MRVIMPIIALLMATPAYADRMDGPFYRHCSFNDAATNFRYDGICVERHNTSNTSGDNFTATYTFKGRTVRVEYLDSFGRWKDVMINGVRGRGYEIDRTHLDFNTLAVKGVNLEVSNRE